MKKLYQYNGVIHAHSTYSDGQKSIPEIAAIANELDIDFLLMSDHNTLQPKIDGLEGWYDRVLVGIGTELNDAQDKNHYLSFNIEKPVNHLVKAEEYIKSVRNQDGFGIVAHPDETRSSIAAYPPYPWTLWDSDLFDGIEIWNQMSEWLEGLTHFNKFWRAMHPRRSIKSPKKETLARWDAISKKRKIVGVGGVDAHGHIHKLWGLFPIRIFRYKVSFRTIRTHILTEQPLLKEDYQKSMELVYSAIRNANCFVSHRLLGDASNFRFYAENKHGIASIGESLTYGDNTKIIVQNPVEAKTCLIRDGKIVDCKQGLKLEFKLDEPGVYRVETIKSGKNWIFSNHIWINR